MKETGRRQVPSSASRRDSIRRFTQALFQRPLILTIIDAFEVCGVAAIYGSLPFNSIHKKEMKRVPKNKPLSLMCYKVSLQIKRGNI